MCRFVARTTWCWVLLVSFILQLHRTGASFSMHQSHRHLPSFSNQSLDGSYIRDADIVKRFNDNDDDDLRIATVVVLTSTVPIWSAARALESFYTSILSHAMGPWANLRLLPRLDVDFGCLLLTMRVITGDRSPRRGIPWIFVRNFARNMLTMTRLGFTGTYSILYLSVIGPDLGVVVELRVRWEEIQCHIPSFTPGPYGHGRLP